MYAPLLYLLTLLAPPFPLTVPTLPQRSLPPLADLSRFPSEAECQAVLVFNEEWTETFRLRAALYPEQDDWASQAIAEAHWSRCVWRQTCLASHGAQPHRLGYRSKRPEPWVVYFQRRRDALRELRDLIGPADYFSGTLPAPMPLWALRRVEE